MTNLCHLSTVLIACLVASGGALAGKPVLECSSSVASGCVGECGDPFFIRHRITLEDVKSSARKRQATMCLYTVSSNLCPNTDALYEISKNGIPVAKGDLSDFEEGIVAGNVGDILSVAVMLAPDKSDIVCAKLGETRFNLGYANKVTK